LNRCFAVTWYCARRCWSREAAEQDKSLTAHCAHLIVHGVLHLQAYDHETGEQEATEMEGLERRVLAALGYPDPYRGED
jgi:probable rRNA maturation factor